jgi:FixJ family two-component response regulator
MIRLSFEDREKYDAIVKTLTRRQKQILAGILLPGATNEQVGEICIPPITRNTVRVHCAHLKRKLGKFYPPRPKGGKPAHGKAQ